MPPTETTAREASQEAPIEATIELTAKDKERAIGYNYFVRRKLVLIDVIFFLLLAFTLIFLKYTGLVDIPDVLVFCSFGVVILLAIFFAFIKMMASAGPRGPKRYVTATEAALKTKVSGEKKEFTIAWQDFIHKGKTKNYFFLYPDNTQFLILPKRCFSEEEIRRLNQYIK